MGVIIPQVITEDKAGGAQIIDGSLRFDSSKSHYLSRTPSSVGSRTTWTWSGWIKRNSISTFPDNNNHVFSAGSNVFSMRLDANDGSNRIEIYNYNGSTFDFQLITTQVFRDFSAWFHLVLVLDTSNATTSDRVRLYINGQRVTIFSTSTYPSSSFAAGVNNNTEHRISSTIAGTAYLSAQLSNIYLIDGQALDPSYFGYTDPLTNTWRPKKLKSGAATINDGRTWSSNYGNLRTAGTQTNPFDSDNTNYAQVSVTNGGYFTFPDGLNGRLEVLASTGSSTDGASTQTVTISNNSGVVTSRTTSRGYNSGAETLDFGVVSGITSVFLTDSGLFWGFRINSIALRDGVTETIGFGTNGFYLPLDGNTPIGQNMSGNVGINTWTPVNFGGSNTLEKATGALPILNTDGGGKVARVGVRTDSAVGVGTCVLALPLVGIKSDFSNQVDSRSSNKVVTATNSVASSTQSNFYGGSWYFDGTADSLAVSSNSDLALGNTWTIEFWFYNAGSGGAADARLYYFHSNTNNLQTTTTGTQLLFYNGSSATTFGNIGLNTWIHVAAVNSSGTVRFYINGNQNSSTTSAGTFSGSQALTIGAFSDGTSNCFTGYIQDFRIYNGVAKYTQNFIPASTDPDILPDTPSGVSYSSNVKKITDGAVAFDGSGDWLSLPTSSDFSCSSGTNFTFEAFIYPTAVSDTTPFGIGNNAGFAYRIISGSPYLYIAASGGILNTGTIVANKWTHIAVTRNSGTLYSFIDGVLVGSVANSGSFDGTQQNFIGAANLTGAGSPGYTFTGQISNAYWVNGTALYTSNFTPPTAPITSVANTKLLCCKSSSSATVFDVSPGTITANGNAVASNFNPFNTDINTVRGQESGYCTFNPLASTTTLSNGNLNTTMVAYPADYGRGTIGITSGKYYFEATKISGGEPFLGVSTSDSGATSNNYGYHGNGYIYYPGGYVGPYSTIGTGDIIAIAVDSTAGSVAFYRNGILVYTFTGITASVYYPFYGGTNGGSTTVSWNFGQKPFKFPPPDGFQPLALANTPRPTIVRPDQYVGIVTYTGNGSTQTISGLKFKPDLIIAKSRSTTYYHNVVDSVRGTGKVLYTNTTGADDTNSNVITAFTSDGFSVGSDASANQNGGSMVAWCWKAGGNSNTYNINDIGYSTASAAGLTAGTITPTGASVNTKSGFSIIGYTGTGVSNSTVSHGLGRVPSFAIVKSRGSNSWFIRHNSLATNTNLNFDTGSGVSPGGSGLIGDLSSSTTFTLVGGSNNADNINANGTTYISYLWAEIPGFSKFGSYTGNGSSDGPMVVTGFRPRWILLKSSSISGTWVLYDTTRDTYNYARNRLFPASSSSESSGANYIDILSNGFKHRDSDPWTNQSGDTYIYAAFAESPSFNLYGGQSNAR